MTGLMERARTIGAARAKAVAGKLAEAARAELPDDVTIRRERDAIVLEGKALLRRALTEAALRGLVALARTVLTRTGA